MPPTAWQTEILAPGIWAGAMPRIWRTLSCSAYMPYIPECMYERPPPLVLSGSLPPGGVAVGDEDAGLAARHKAEVFEPVDRQMREGVVDHQVVDVVVRDAGLGKAVAPATRKAREEVKPAIWVTIGVSVLSPVPRR